MIFPIVHVFAGIVKKDTMKTFKILLDKSRGPCYNTLCSAKDSWRRNTGVKERKRPPAQEGTLIFILL